MKLEDLAEELGAYDYKNSEIYCGDLSDWEVPDIPDMEKRMVIVKNGRTFKTLLKSREYQWFTVSQTWQLEFPTLNLLNKKKCF